jgi:hypothetical protein
MRNYFLGAAALLLVGGMSFAQNPGQQAEEAAQCVNCPPEAPEMAPAFVLPGFNLEGPFTNQSYLNQVGVGNEAFVKQDGANISEIDQQGDPDKVGTDDYPGFSNLAVVTQLGMNYSNIKQHGDNNRSYVDQDGYYNTAFVDIGVGYAENNLTVATQKGFGNYSMQYVRWDNNTAYVNQHGWGNMAFQDQRTGKDKVAGSEAAVNQIGTLNKAVQIQTGSDNGAYAEQIGLLNVSVQRQDSPKGDDVAGNDSWTYQFGFGNMSLSDQMGTANQAILQQIGGDNLSCVQQTGTGNLSLASQLGHNNTYHAVQNGVMGGAN